MGGKIIGLDTFGESAPAGVLYKHLAPLLKILLPRLRNSCNFLYYPHNCYSWEMPCLIVSRVQIMQTSSPCLRVCIHGMGLIQKKHCFAVLQQQIAGSVTTRVAPIAAMKFQKKKKKKKSTCVDTTA